MEQFENMKNEEKKQRMIMDTALLIILSKIKGAREINCQHYHAEPTNDGPGEININTNGNGHGKPTNTFSESIIQSHERQITWIKLYQ